MFKKKSGIILAVVILLFCAGIGMMVWETSDHSILYTLQTVFHKPDKTMGREYPIEDLEDYQGEPVTLVVYDERTYYIGMQEGWFARILQEQFNIKLDIRGIDAAPEDCDVNIWACRQTFEEADMADLEILDTDFVKKYGIYIYQEYSHKLIRTDKEEDTYYGIEDSSTVPGIWTIGKNSKHKELALCFIDWMASTEGRQTCRFGPKGLCWEYDKEGKMVATSFGLKCMGDKAIKMPQEFGGKNWWEGRPKCSLMSSYSYGY